MKGRRGNDARLILLAAAVLGLFLLRFLDWSGRFDRRSAGGARKNAVPIYASPGTTMIATKVVFRENGRKAWEFSADRIARSPDGLVITAAGINEGRVMDGDKVAYSFKAGALRYEVLTGFFSVQGGLVGVMHEGRGVFRAEEALVDTRRKKLTVPGSVSLSSDELSLNADSLEADLTEETVLLKGNAVVKWSGGTMRAEEIRYSAKDGTFSVSGTEAGGVELVL